MAFQYQILVGGRPAAFGDPAFDASTAGILAADLRQALDIYSQLLTGRALAGQGALIVDMAIAPTTRASGSPTGVGYPTIVNGIGLYPGTAAFEMTYGLHVPQTASDISILLSPDYISGLNLAGSGALADAKLDAVSVFLHELMHGFGVFGWRDDTGALPLGYESVFDSLSRLSPSGAGFFYGPVADLIYGGPVPLTSTSLFGENWYHLGDTQSDFRRNPATVQDPLTLDLINGVVTFYSHQYSVSSLDLGILRDLGYVLAVDQLQTRAGGHIYLIGPGHSIVTGGAGLNTALFNGPAGQYAIAEQGGSIAVLDSVAGRDGAAFLTQVQQLRFSDVTVVFDLRSAQDLLTYELYQATFGRMPDNYGFRYWAQSADILGLSPAGLADAFLNAPEFAQRFGANPGNADFVAKLYANVLGRAPDAGGQAYWTHQADAGLAHDQLLVAFATSAENVQLIGAHIAHGFWTT